MFVMRTVEDSADSLGQLVSSEQPVGLDHLALAMDPLGLYWIEPRTLLGQKAAYDPHAPAVLFDPAVVSSDPPSHLSAYMPAGVVPDQHPNSLADRFELLGAPPKKASRYTAHRPTASTKRNHTSSNSGNKKPVTGDGLRIGIIFLNRLLHQAQRLARIAPTVKGRSRQPAEPGLVAETHDPLGVAVGESHQPYSSRLFFLRTRGQERLSTVWLAPSAPPSSPKWPGWFRR